MTDKLSQAFLLTQRHDPALVRFSADGKPAYTDTPPPGYVRRQGVIFKLGDYPDKSFSLNEQEADHAIAQFVPVEGDLEHKPTILSGKLGVMRRIWRDGVQVFGAADVPEWLDNALKDTASTVSCAWSRANKTLKGWGWVLEPAVQGASLVSTFAAFALDHPAEAQASASALLAAATVTELPVQKRRFGMPLGDKLREVLQRRQQGGQALFSSGSPGGGTQPTPGTGTGIGTGTPPPTTNPTPTAPPPTTPTPPPAPTTPGTPQAYTAAQEEAEAQFQATRIVNRAVESVDRLILDRRLMPSGKKVGLAFFTALGYNDEAGPAVVSFSKEDGTEIPDLLGMLAEFMRHTVQHDLFSQNFRATVLNGDAAGQQSVTKSLEEQGERQAAEFNQGMIQNMPSLAPIAHMYTPQNGNNGAANGNGNH